LEILPVTLSASAEALSEAKGKGLAQRTKRSFAALRMTPLKSAHGKPSLQMSSGDIASSTGYLLYVTLLTRKETWEGL